MTKPILLIEHANQPKEERVSDLLAADGHEFHWCNPSNGDVLPDNFDDYKATIVYGGMEGAYDPHPFLADELSWINRWVVAGKPYLGICLGGQLLAKAMGGNAYADALGRKEIGFHRIRSENPEGLWGDLPACFFQWHGDTFDLPEGAVKLASSENFANQAFALGPKVLGLQFHPEVTLEVAQTWFQRYPEVLAAPGMKSLPEIEAQFRQYDGQIENWTQRLLREWLS